MANLKDKPTNAEKKAFKNKVKKMKDKDNNTIFTDQQLEDMLGADDDQRTWEEINAGMIAYLKDAPKAA